MKNDNIQKQTGEGALFYNLQSTTRKMDFLYHLIFHGRGVFLLTDCKTMPRDSHSRQMDEVLRLERL